MKYHKIKETEFDKWFFRKDEEDYILKGQKKIKFDKPVCLRIDWKNCNNRDIDIKGNRLCCMPSGFCGFQSKPIIKDDTKKEKI